MSGDGKETWTEKKLILPDEENNNEYNTKGNDIVSRLRAEAEDYKSKWETASATLAELRAEIKQLSIIANNRLEEARLLKAKVEVHEEIFERLLDKI